MMAIFGQWTTTVLAILFPLPPGGSKWNLSNIGLEAPEEKSVEILNIFPYKCIGTQTWPHRKKCQISMFDHYFRKLVDLPSLIIYAKIQLQDILCSGGKDVLNVFTIYGHDGHLGQWTATILAVFHFPAPGRLQMKSKQHWLKGSRG